jgi:tetratricopeptide (TPR) repeat protein
MGSTAAGQTVKTWLLRLLTAVASPLVALLLLEAGLRLAGYGYPTGFFLPTGDGKTVVSNPRFGYRFFPPRLARAPMPLRLERDKPDGSIRLFILGGSAAYGTPDPSLGFGPMLELLLEHAFPTSDFEVVVTAMAAINSHVVREIAKDCAELEPDFFLVYLGNNEVVGPFGPGSTLGRFTPSRTFARLNIQLRRLRLAQLIRNIVGRLANQHSAVEWQGMEMFLAHRIAYDDPRLDGVADAMTDNLRHIIHSGRRGGADVLISTMATNIMSPPFASLHDPNLSDQNRARWTALYERGLKLLDLGNADAAAVVLEQARQLDFRYAELQFALGTALLQPGQREAAWPHLNSARNHDALRFRADDSVNERIREIVTESGSSRDLLETAELFDQAQIDGSNEIFYEHAHLDFAGNYFLASHFFSQLVKPIANRVGIPAPTPDDPRSQPRWLSEEEMAQRLGMTPHDRYINAMSMLELEKRPPFTHQLGHEKRLTELRDRLHELRLIDLAERQGSRERYLEALSRAPENHPLRARYAAFEARIGNSAAAVEQWQQLVAMFPSAAHRRTALAFVLADEGRLDEALQQLGIVADLYPESAEAHSNLGSALTAAGDLEAAEAALERALELAAGSSNALINLAKLREAQQRPDTAESIYRALVEQDPSSSEALQALAELLDRQGRIDEAEESYRAAIDFDPDIPLAANNLGFLLERQQRYEEAILFYRQAIEADPGYALAYFNLGDALLSTGFGAEAGMAYAAGLELDPANKQARRNLELATAAARR